MSENKKIISILGGGWIGFDLALSFLKKNSTCIKISTTTREKMDHFIKNKMTPFLINSSNKNFDNKILSEFLICDTLVIAIPPKKDNPNYLDFLEKISSHENTKFIKQVIFISSSSVYPNVEKTFTEKEIITTDNSSKSIVYKAEKIFLDSKLNSIILRCAGLMGYDRIAGKYFANKILDCKEAKVNYVHKDDVIAIINLLVQKKANSAVYNLCSSLHPTKEEVYLSNALKHHFEKPIFKESKKYKTRIIDGSKVTKELGYIYKYHNPLDYD